MSEEKNKAVDVVAAIEVAATVDAVNEIIQDDTRKTVQEAATLRIAQLEETPETTEEEAPETSTEDDADARQEKAAKNKKAHAKFLKSQKGYEFKGKSYVFKDHTPATLSYGGKVRSLADLLKDKDAMDALISGGSGFIKFKR